MAERLLNKVAVVTGAGSGIGKSIAEQFLNEGAKVVVFGRDRERLQAVAETAPARVLVVDGDVTQAADLRQLVAATTRRFGKIDVLIPNAGIARVVPFAECNAETVAEQFDVNFMGALQTVRAFLPNLNANSSVIFMTAFVARTAVPGLSVFNASKAALKALALSLATELAPNRVRVNCIAPGPTETSLWNNAELAPETLKQLADDFKNRLIPQSFGQPNDIAETAVFLASDASRNIHGQEIVVDGGHAVS